MKQPSHTEPSDSGSATSIQLTTIPWRWNSGAMSQNRSTIRATRMPAATLTTSDGFRLMAVALVIHIVVWLLFSYLSRREAATVGLQYPLGASQSTRLPPEPRLQATPRQDLQDLHRREEEVLNSYRWVDRNAGTVRIPIKEAIRITLAKGLPARPPAPQGTP